MQTIAQNSFTKGLVPVASELSQPKGIVRRISNMVYSRRGALKTIDGSLVVASLNGSGPSTGQGPFTRVLLFTPTGASPYYLALQEDPTTQLTAPIGLGATAVGSGGSFAAGTYYWKVTAVDGDGGETTASNEASAAVVLNGSATLAWTAVTNATGYNVYRGTAAGAENVLVKSNVATNGYTDTGSAGTSQSPPATNTTQQLVLIKIAGNSYTKPASIVAKFPADFQLPPVDGTPGGGGGSGSGGGGSGPITPVGGISGNTSVLPDMKPFAGGVCIALGNGYAPQFWNGSSAAALANSFTAAYPAWSASTQHQVGDLIQPATPNGFFYRCNQAGQTAASSPTFPTTQNSEVSDGGVIWQWGGPTSTPAPRGAAHLIVHAGALWLWNTSPAMTADLQDGPSVLKMSNIDDPNSWNPANVAIVDKDDGQQGMGLADFTIAEEGIAPTGSLVLFKEFSTYQVIGVFGSSNFEIQRAQTNMGNLAPRSIQFLPGFGVARLAHLGVAIFNGVRDIVVSEEVRPYFFGGISDINPMDWTYAYAAKGAQTANPPMYWLAIPTIGSNGSLNRIMGFDLVSRAWTVIDLPWSISDLTSATSLGSFPLTISGGSSDGTIRRLQAGDPTWDNTSVQWSFETPEVAKPGAAAKLLARKIIVRGIGTAPALNAYAVADGSARPSRPMRISNGPMGDGQFYAYLDIAERAENIRANISGAGPIEIDAVDWQIQPMPEGGPQSIL